MDKYKKGLLITLEGGEGAGKTTQATVISEFFQKNNRKTLEIREPGSTIVGEKVREIIREAAEPLSPLTELLLFSAARKELIQNIIIPALKDKKVVICDRFIDSTFAYQHYGRKIPIETVQQLISLSTQNIKPDMTILLDIDFKLAMKRKDGSLDYLEKESYEFHENVRSGYKIMATQEPKRWITINATQEQEIISKEIVTKLKRWIINENQN
ncbi:MAG: dTMP kinase [Dehalococcoidia bacterium]|nr:dTMP kinase [Dehalococcoidia bacterium]